MTNFKLSHHSGCDCAVKCECSASERVTDRCFYGPINIYFPSSGVCKTASTFSYQSEQRTQQSKDGRRQNNSAPLFRKSKREAESGTGRQERGSANPGHSIRLSGASHLLVTINPLQTNRNPICSNK